MTPKDPSERLETIDVLRGVALLGILLLNVRGFAMVVDGYAYPLADTTADLAAYSATTIFAFGKFITIFSALYGVGLLLASEGREAAGLPVWPTFLRRSGILAVVGLGHMLFIWQGDILFMYAVLGTAAFAMRHLSVRLLAILAVGAHVAMTLLMLGLFGILWIAATLDPDFIAAEELMMSDADAAAQTASFLGSYLDQLSERLYLAATTVPFILIFYSLGILGNMIGGIALFKAGFFTHRPTGLGWALLLLVIGWGGTAAVVARSWSNGWPVLSWLTGDLILISLLALPSAVGIATVVIRLAKHLRLLAPVGRMALTNYLLQSVLGTFVFYGGWGLGAFGSVGYAGQLLFVVGVWCLQIPLSYLWLRRFRFGPAEWLWRAATYGKLPPLRLSHEQHVRGV